MPKFGILGLGYIAPRHLQAIDDIGGQVMLAYDNSSGINIPLSKEVEIPKSELDFFDKASKLQLDFISICSPTYAHEDQIIKSLTLGANAIVEKPLCLSLKGLEQIQHVEKVTNKKAYSIFQLRNHPIAKEIKNADNQSEKNGIHLVYRGNREEEYFNSWKGDIKLSGGVFAAVGIHYFDLLTKQFGPIKQLISGNNSAKKSTGEMELERARVSWDFEFIPSEIEIVKVQRQFIINKQEIDGSAYTNNLHSIAYQDIINGDGVTTSQARKTIEILDFLT